MSLNPHFPRNTILAVAVLALLGWSAAQSQDAPATDSVRTTRSGARAPMESRRGTPGRGLPMMFKEGGMGAMLGRGSGGGGFPAQDPSAQQQFELRQLLDQYSGLDDVAEQEKVKETIHTLLTQMFEQRQERRAAEIADVEKRLVKLKELHKKREEMKKTIIANRLQQLLEDSEGLGWGDETPSPPAGLLGNFFGNEAAANGFGSFFGGNPNAPSATSGDAQKP